MEKSKLSLMLNSAIDRPHLRLSAILLILSYLVSTMTLRNIMTGLRPRQI